MHGPKCQSSATFVLCAGGAAALVAATITGPRTGRFTADGQVVEMPGCNPAFQALGTFILWFGWCAAAPETLKQLKPGQSVPHLHVW